MKDQRTQTPALEIRALVKRLKKISGRDIHGRSFNLSEREAIAGLQDGNWTFHMRLNGREIPIIVAADRAGNKFLAARVDGRITDDLLLLSDDGNLPL